VGSRRFVGRIMKKLQEIVDRFPDKVMLNKIICLAGYQLQVRW
jgi:hypothetical protein